jgi:hypothetical protein
MAKPFDIQLTPADRKTDAAYNTAKSYIKTMNRAARQEASDAIRPSRQAEDSSLAKRQRIEVDLCGLRSA